MTSGKPILCLDFDGVIHSYTSGWQGPDVVADPPVPGALRFIERASEHFIVCIFSSRSNQRGGIEAMATWLGDWAMKDRLTGRTAHFDCVNTGSSPVPATKRGE